MSYNYVQSPVKQAFYKSLQVWNFQGGAQVCNSDPETLPRPHLPEPRPRPRRGGAPGDQPTPRGDVGHGLPGPPQAGLAVSGGQNGDPGGALPHMLLDTQSRPNPSQQHSSGFPPATESSPYLPLRSGPGCVSWPDIGKIKKVLCRQ